MRLLSFPLRLLAALFLALLCACGMDGELFFLRHKDADMPAWVRGNTASGTYVLFLHGGPGSTAIAQADLPFFRALEERYAVVYWEQRASGSSQGNVDVTSLTLAQFVEDTDLVVELLRERHAPKQLFLMGHSWGGLLGTAYLTQPERQAKVTGWIEIDGAHDLRAGNALSRDWVLARAEERLHRGERVELWSEAKRFYEARPVLGQADLAQHVGYVRAAGGDTFDPSQAPHSSLVDTLFSPADLPSILHNEPAVARSFPIMDLSLTSQMRAITLPSLVVWGRHDGILPVPLATQAFEALGAPAEDKRLVVLERSAHSPLREQPRETAEAVISFVEAQRGTP